jgi:hypothetical protein
MYDIMETEDVEEDLENRIGDGIGCLLSSRTPVRLGGGLQWGH